MTRRMAALALPLVAAWCWCCLLLPPGIASGQEPQPQPQQKIHWRVTVTVTVGNGPAPPAPAPVPPPTPPPEPGPGPTPTPPAPVAVKGLWVMVIEETAEASERRGAFFTDRGLAERMRSKEHRWRVVDRDVKDPAGRVPADLAPWLKRAEGKRLPWLFLIAPDGRVLHEGALPATPAGLVELLGKAGG